MDLTLQAITDEGMQGQLGSPTPLAEAIYRLYMCPENLARPAPRIVVLNDDAEWRAFEADRRTPSIELEPDAASELLWRTLFADGQRIGEVTASLPVQAGDYVLCRDGDHYRVSMPVEREEADPIGRGWVPRRSLPSQDHRGFRVEFRFLQP